MALASPPCWRAKAAVSSAEAMFWSAHHTAAPSRAKMAAVAPAVADTLARVLAGADDDGDLVLEAHGNLACLRSSPPAGAAGSLWPRPDPYRSKAPARGSAAPICPRGGPF